MRQEKRQTYRSERPKGQTVATVCFLLLSALFLFACTQLVGNMLRQELLQSPAAQASTPPPPAMPPPNTPAPEEPVTDVSAILLPQSMMEDAGNGEQNGAETPAPATALAVTPTPAPTPAPTLHPLISAPPLSKQSASFVLIGFDKRERADWLALIDMQDGGVTVLSVPRNTLSASETPLSRATSKSHALRLLRTVWPVNYLYYVELRLSGIPLFVDQCGGVTLDGAERTGEQAVAWLSQGGGDEILRIARQQTFLRACLAELQQLGWLKLMTFKLTLQGFADSNLSTAQLLELYTQFKQIDIDTIRFSTLPVDSVTIEGERCYLPDAARINRMLED